MEDLALLEEGFAPKKTLMALEKQAGFEWLAHAILQRAIGKRFHAVWSHGAEHLAALPKNRGVLVCVNHTNWWDGFVLSNWLHPYRTRFERDQYLAMEQENLARYRMLGKMGAFGLELRDPRKLVAGMRRAVHLLKEPGTLVWMFPQGVIRHPTAPIRIKPGANLLASRAKVPILPAALRYEWLVESRPSVMIRFAPPLPHDADEATLQTAMQTVYDASSEAVETLDFKEWTRETPTRLSINKWWDRLRWTCIGKGKNFEELNR